jgi:hypothetical protein
VAQVFIKEMVFSSGKTHNSFPTRIDLRNDQLDWNSGLSLSFTCSLKYKHYLSLGDWDGKPIYYWFALCKQRPRAFMLCKYKYLNTLIVNMGFHLISSVTATL